MATDNGWSKLLEPTLRKTFTQAYGGACGQGKSSMMLVPPTLFKIAQKIMDGEDGPAPVTADSVVDDILKGWKRG